MRPDWATHIVMGQYFKIVNPAKRQYIDADRFHENIKASGVLFGHHATAVAFLVCNMDQVRVGRGQPVYSGTELAGSWCGDPIYIVGDDQGEADEFGIKTATDSNPARNLNQMAKEEFEDVSYKAIALICNVHEEIAEELASSAARGYSRDTGLVHLGNVVFTVGCKSLESALEKEFGSEWVSSYKKAYAKH